MNRKEPKKIEPQPSKGTAYLIPLNDVSYECMSSNNEHLCVVHAPNREYAPCFDDGIWWWRRQN